MLSLIYLICFLDLLSLAILLPVAPVHLLSIGASRFLIGALGSLHALLQLCSGPLVGSWSDTKGRKPLLIQCLFLILISNLLLLKTSSLYTYVASRILFGLTCHIQILLKALIASGVPKLKQNDVFAMMGAIAGLSFVVGPLLGGVLSSMDNGFFFIAVLLNIFAVINLCISFLVSDVQPKEVSKEANKQPILLELTQAFVSLSQINWDTYWDVFLFKFLVESGYSAFFTTFGIMLMDLLGATQGQMGVIISLFSMTMIVMNINIGKINAKFYVDDSSGYIRNVHGFLGLLFSFSLLYLYNGFWSYVLVMVGMGIFRAILDTTWSEMLVNRTTDADRGTIMGTFESIIQMAGLFTPIVTTYIGEIYGYIDTYIIVLMFMSFGVLTGVYCLRTNQQRVKSE